MEIIKHISFITKPIKTSNWKRQIRRHKIGVEPFIKQRNNEVDKQEQGENNFKIVRKKQTYIVIIINTTKQKAICAENQCQIAKLTIKWVSRYIEADGKDRKVDLKS